MKRALSLGGSDLRLSQSFLCTDIPLPFVMNPMISSPGTGLQHLAGLGLMLGVELEDKKASEVVENALSEGLMILTAKDKIRLLPPLTITYDEIDKGLEILKKVLD